MDIYESIPPWSSEEIEIELDFLRTATARPTNTPATWLLLWVRLNQMQDLRMASNAQRARFDGYAALIFDKLSESDAG